jgi:hypothetical protein
MVGDDGEMLAFQLRETRSGFGMGALPDGDDLLAMGLRGRKPSNMTRRRCSNTCAAKS